MVGNYSKFFTGCTYTPTCAPGRPQKAGGVVAPPDRCRPSMNGNPTHDSDDPESIDTADERYLSPLRHGAQLIQNPTREADRGTTTFEQHDGRAFVNATGQFLKEEPGYVQLTISAAAAQFRVTLDPETARTLAADLDIAARGAEDPEEVADEL
jgi:hypothetical protein